MELMNTTRNDFERNLNMQFKKPSAEIFTETLKISTEGNLYCRWIKTVKIRTHTKKGFCLRAQCCR